MRTFLKRIFSQQSVEIGGFYSRIAAIYLEGIQVISGYNCNIIDLFLDIRLSATDTRGKGLYNMLKNNTSVILSD